MEIRRIFPSRPEIISTGPIAATRLPLLLAGAAFTGRRLALELESEYLHVLRVVILAFLKGLAPILAIEMGRRAIPERVRPSFDEMEKGCRKPSAAAASPEAEEAKPAGGSAA